MVVPVRPHAAWYSHIFGVKSTKLSTVRRLDFLTGREHRPPDPIRSCLAALNRPPVKLPPLVGSAVRLEERRSGSVQCTRSAPWGIPALHPSQWNYQRGIIWTVSLREERKSPQADNPPIA